MPMSSSDAQGLVGHQPEGDYRLDLASHLALFSADKCPPLHELLSDPAVTARRDAYDEYDRRAAQEQAGYKRWMTIANRAVLASSVFGGGIMAAEILKGAVAPESWVATIAWTTLFGCGAALSGVAAVAALTMVRESRMYEAWMSSRAQAETERLAYFSTIAELANLGTVDHRLLALEYIRRFQLDVQRIYYGSRGQRHRSSASYTIMWTVAAAGLAAIPGLIGTVIEASWGPALALFGVIGGALAAYAAARETIYQDRRNAERYDRTRALLVAVSATLGRVRAAVANASDDGQKASSEALKGFVDAVNDQISLEHRQFLEEAKGASPAIERLQKVLDDAHA
jgi:hypothetical protein